MNFVSIRVITTNVDRLVNFYERVTDLPATRHTVDFAELQTPSCTLAIGGTTTLPLFGAEGSVEAGANRTAVLEFIVANVDAVYEQLCAELQYALVQAPTLLPWGNKSLLFRDPDGNLVNFFSPASPEARAKFAGKVTG